MSANTQLVVGCTGVGKTWVMKRLLATRHPQHWNDGKVGLIRFKAHKKTIILGLYNGEMFEGSDRLSMAVARDFSKLRKLADHNGLRVICEGDRFTNAKFIEVMEPEVLLIAGDGAEGRANRGSEQTAAHIQRIATRISRIEPHRSFADSAACLDYLKGGL